MSSDMDSHIFIKIPSAPPPSPVSYFRHGHDIYIYIKLNQETNSMFTDRDFFHTYKMPLPFTFLTKDTELGLGRQIFSLSTLGRHLGAKNSCIPDKTAGYEHESPKPIQADGMARA